MDLFSTTSLIPALAFVIFIVAYLFITLEAKIRVSKSAWALAAGGLLWVLVALVHPALVEEEMVHVGYDIFSIVLFLLGAMSLVEILVHYRFFDVIRSKLVALKLTNRAQFALIAGITFFASAIIDNLTATIVMIQIARRFFKDEELVLAAAAIVIAANAGGAWSPIGDVTTIMLWIAGKFTVTEIVSWALLPSLAIMAVTLAWFLPRVRERADDAPDEPVPALTRGETAVVAIALLSFLFPVAAKFIHLPPALGILFGVGVTWIAVELIKRVSHVKTHLDASIEHLIQKTDISSIKFFVGILLAVAALNTLGVLGAISQTVFGTEPSFWSVVFGTIGLGFLSAVLDNIPLTAIAINILPVTDSTLWALVALGVGTGGSMLIIGSAAGVVAMGMVPQLTFGKYLKVGFVPACLGFLAAVAVWLVQHALVF